MNRIVIDPEERFSVGGENFVITVPMTGRRLSTGDAFTIAKNEAYIRVYEDLASSFSPRSILELGIYEGGSYVLLDKLFRPSRMSAVDMSPNPIDALCHYVEGKQDRFLHFSTSQSNREVLENTVQNELANELDFVVDDASHTYEETRASFEILFPLLQPGGIYLIEDWSWAHHRGYQSPDAPFFKRPALSNLLFEQIMLMASTHLIAELRIWSFLYLIRKTNNAHGGTTPEPRSIFEQIRSRGKKWNPI
jgi:predicted O-methyltransferase YrrM